MTKGIAMKINSKELRVQEGEKVKLKERPTQVKRVYPSKEKYHELLTVKARHNEFREMIKALHQADIEVVLDVVYSHTGEGGHTDAVYRYKGIDNSTYYLMADRPCAPYENFLRHRQHAQYGELRRAQDDHGQRPPLGA